MKSFSNIDKHPLHAGTYIGYTAKGYGRRIVKSNSSFGNWCALPHPNEGQTARAIYAMRLADMSVQLAKTQ